MPPKRRKSPSPSPSRREPQSDLGLFEAVVGPLLLLIPAPLLCLLLAWLTSDERLPDGKSATLAGLVHYGYEHGIGGLFASVFELCGVGDSKAWVFLFVFNFCALLLYWWPGPTKYGPTTPTGHEPDYTDNGLAHCFLSTLMFVGGSNLGLGFFDLGIVYDTFPATLGALNIFGLVFCVFLYFKGLYAPSGTGRAPDSGRSGSGVVFDYYWGMELYPRIWGVDVKKFVNCRFSMSYWQLAGISFAYKSYTLHGQQLDPGLVLAALSQYIYLVKFFYWEIGYMRSIDIIVDRAGFYETWGCLTFVPSVYTFHTRLLVRNPSGLSWMGAGIIFVIGLAGVLLNFWADNQRQIFREQNGQCLVWGAKPQFVRATYQFVDAATGKVEQRKSLLLASGWWGIARHFQYAFELTAAWSWGLLGSGGISGLLDGRYLGLFYPIFLTILLVHRAKRDEEKCLAKYGNGYREYMKLVRYKIVPGLY